MKNRRLYLAVAGLLIGLVQAVGLVNYFGVERTGPASDATYLLCLIPPFAGAACAVFLARNLERSMVRWGIASFLIPIIPISILSIMALKQKWGEWRHGLKLQRIAQTRLKTQTTPLVAQLISKDLAERQLAIKEVYARTAQGDRSGFDAIEEALEKLAGRSNLDLYRTTGKLDTWHHEYADLAPDSLISLAETGKLLENPRMTQLMIHQAATTGQANRIMKRVTEIGGKALHAYQLLGVDLQVYAELRSKGTPGLPK